MSNSSDIGKSPVLEKLYRLGERNFYTEAVLELTSRCNASCDCCYVLNNKKSDLPLHKVKYIIDKLADSGLLFLGFTGGEPFLRDDILQIFDYTLKNSFWSFHVLSNGIMLTQKHLDYLKSNSKYIRNFQMSLFSHDPNIHDRYMGVKGAHKKIIQTADFLMNAGIQVTISYNVLDFNYEDFEKTVNLIKKHSSKRKIGVTKLKNFCRDGCNSERLTNSTNYDFYQKLFKKAPSLALGESTLLKQAFRSPSDSSSRKLCGALTVGIYIDSSGNLKPCVAFRNIQKGNIFDEGNLTQITEGYPIYKQLKSLTFSDIDGCIDCKFNCYCNLCVGISHNETGSIKHPAPQYCDYASAVGQFHDSERNS